MTYRCQPSACSTCPYRRATPPGVWHYDEYEKLRAWDAPTWDQPRGVFLCHVGDHDDAADSHVLCRGWVAVHGADALGLRLAAAAGTLDDGVAAAVGTDAADYYGSGNEAADAGQAGIEAPLAEARYAIEKVRRVRARQGSTRPVTGPPGLYHPTP